MARYWLSHKYVYRIRKALSKHADYLDTVFDNLEVGDQYRNISRKLTNKTYEYEKEGFNNDIGFFEGHRIFELVGDEIWQVKRALKNAKDDETLAILKAYAK